MLVKERIIKEIDKLPENMLIEIYDFVKYLEMKKEKELLTSASQKISESSFDEIWNNEEDSVYDKL